MYFPQLLKSLAPRVSGAPHGTSMAIVRVQMTAEKLELFRQYEEMQHAQLEG